MTADRKTDSKDAPAPSPSERERVAYETPAISWEEPFEVVVASSCSLLPIQGGPCSVKAQV